MEQFCAGGSTLTFPNSSGAGDMGPIGCLYATPNPSWYFIQIEDSGYLEFNISQVTNTEFPIDVDFDLWGPFGSIGNAITAIQTNLEGSALVGCSYSDSSQEVATIFNAQTDAVYVFLITNYDGQTGQISLTQTGGDGSTSCDFICGVSLGHDIITCQNSHKLQAVFNANSPDVIGVVYEWTYNENPLPDTTSTIVVTQDGGYIVTAQLAGCSEPAIASINIMLNYEFYFEQIDDVEICADEYFYFSDITNILIQQHPNDSFNILYFSSLEDAEIIRNPLPLNYQAESNQTIYVRITDDQLYGCLSIITFNIIVKQHPGITSIDDVYAICNGEPIIIIVPDFFDSYQWSNGSSGSSISVSQEGLTLLLLLKMAVQ